MGAPRVYVCGGDDCRRRRKPHRKLLEALRGIAAVQEVRCQKICDGPVCGVKRGGALQWFESVDGSRARDALVRWVTEGGDLDEVLVERVVDQRAGKLRG